MRNINNIAEYLNYHPHCIFCKKKLSLRGDSGRKNADGSIIYLKLSVKKDLLSFSPLLDSNDIYQIRISSSELVKEKFLRLHSIDKFCPKCPYDYNIDTLLYLYPDGKIWIGMIKESFMINNNKFLFSTNPPNSKKGDNILVIYEKPKNYSYFPLTYNLLDNVTSPEILLKKINTISTLY